MFVTMRDCWAGLTRRGALLMLAALTAPQVIGCRPFGRALIPSKPPALHKSARQLTKPELDDYLTSDRPGKRRTVFRGSPSDFQAGIANRHQRPAVGGGTVSVAIVPEHGNFLIDTLTDFAPARGRVVARIINEGSRVDSVTGLAGGQSAYWFVERDSVPGQRGRLRSVIVRETDATVLKVRSFEVCHPPSAKRYTGPRADFVDPTAMVCAPPLPPTPPPGAGGMGSSIDVGRLGAEQAFSADWIPCDQTGCCIGR